MLYEKKLFPLMLLLLSLTGIALSLLLVFDSALPSWVRALLNCAGGCSPFIRTPHARPLGISFAAVQLFFYLWVFLSYFLFSESGSAYKIAFRMILPFVSLAAFLYGIVFLSPMLRTAFCPYTLSLIVVDALLAALSLFTVLRTSGTLSALMGRYADGQKHLLISDDRRFSVGTFFYFSAVLFLFVIAFSFFIDTRYAQQQSEPKKKTLFERYLETPIENFTLPESSIVTGSMEAPLIIDVFTDPMCGACESFHKSEAKLFAKYGEKITVRYYFHALDAQCNSSVTSSIHPGACTVSEILYAAAQCGIFEKSISAYYDRKKSVRELIAANAGAEKIVEAIIDDPQDVKRVKDVLASKRAHDEMIAHMAAGIEIDIQSTPTLFLRGRRIEGAPSVEALSMVIDHLLAEKK